MYYLLLIFFVCVFPPSMWHKKKGRRLLLLSLWTMMWACALGLMRVNVTPHACPAHASPGGCSLRLTAQSYGRYRATKLWALWSRQACLWSSEPSTTVEHLRLTTRCVICYPSCSGPDAIPCSGVENVLSLVQA